MNLAVSIALFSAAVQLFLAAAMYLLSRAPGWERVRSLVTVAMSAACYNIVDVWATSAPRSVTELGWVLRTNFCLASVHMAGWLWYTFGDESGRWSGLPERVRRLSIATIVIGVTGAATGIIVAHGIPYHLSLPSLGVDYTQPQFSVIGDVGSAWLLLVLGITTWEHVRRARRGVVGSRGLVVGFLLFTLFGFEEILVTAGVFKFVFLADVGFLCAVVPVGIQLGRRFIADAHRLTAMSSRLATEVQERTSERDAAREALLEQERLAALGRLAAGVGHEINNPLQYLFFSLEELRDMQGSAAASPEPLQNAFDASERIRRVVEGLRVYSKGDAESYSPVDIKDVVENALRVAAPQLRMRARVETTFRDAPVVLGDEARLVQVVVNPLVNAVQAIASGGRAEPRIHIRTGTSPGGDAEIEITDDGPGFDEAILPQLGTPYVTTKSSTGGTGLGLFVSRGIMDAHGGTIHLDNLPEGGARVRILIPAMQVDTARAPLPIVAEPEAEVAPVARHILIVDDEPSVLFVLARGLKSRGYRVTKASDGTEAMTAIAKGDVDVIVSDLMMPRMSGMELADAVAREYPTLRHRFIVMTGGAVTPAAEAFVQRDDVAVFVKPVQLGRLCEAIEAVAA